MKVTMEEEREGRERARAKTRTGGPLLRSVESVLWARHSWHVSSVTVTVLVKLIFSVYSSLSYCTDCNLIVQSSASALHLISF